MLNVPTFETVHDIGLFLADAGYDTANITGQLHLTEGLRADLSNLTVQLEKTNGESLLPVLARLFFVGWPVPADVCRRLLPPQFLSNALAAGLLIEKNANLEAQATLIPFANFVVACDSPRLTAGDPDRVVGPGRATLLIARAAVRGQAERTLDIGCGTGVLSIAAAAYSREVTGIDLSPRARAFSEFSAALNGVKNATFACGDGFEPVKGQRFSRILSNPPFFLSPAKTYTFCDSPLELDGFSRLIAQQAPAHLEVGGYFQMISEWVEVKGRPWADRIREWTADSGCDVLVNTGMVSTALQYAEKRFAEAKMLFGERTDESLRRHLDYFAQHQVENVLVGIVTMRKRQGENWFSTIASCPVNPAVPEALEERFATTTAAFQSATELLAGRFRMTADAALDQRISLSEEGWRVHSTDILKTGPFEDRLRIEGAAIPLLQLFDGRLTLEQIAARLAEEASLSGDQARHLCVQLCQRLLQSSFIRPFEPTG